MSYTPTANTASLQKLYIAYFGRPADYWGLAYWENDLANNGGTLANAAQSFSIDTEYLAFAAGKTDGQLINAIYLNLFSHDADVPGLNYWVKEMSPQHLGPEQLTIARVAESIAYGAQAADTVILNDKIAAATAFTGAIDTTPEINGYLGADAFASAAAWLFGVTDQASSDAAVAGANDAVAAAIAGPAQIFTLTPGQDTQTANVFNGTGLTLNALDHLTGATGTANSLNIVDAVGNQNGPIAGATLSNIQTINVSTVGSVGQANIAATTGTGEIKTFDFLGAVAPFDSINVVIGGSAFTLTEGGGGAADFANQLAALLAALVTGTGSASSTDGVSMATVQAANGVALPTITFNTPTGIGDVPTIVDTALVAATAGTAPVVYDLSGITGLTAFNVTASSGNDNIQVGNGTAVNVTDTLVGGAVTVTATDSAVTVIAKGLVTIDGGSTQTVTTAGAVTLGATTGATGAIKVTDTAQAVAVIAIDGGTTVDLTTTATNPGGATGLITIGGGTTQPTGAVTVLDHLTNIAGLTGAGTVTTGGLITVDGGTTVSVTETAVQAIFAAASASNTKIVQAAVTVNGTSDTTSVSVTQTPAVTAVATALAKTAVTETGSGVFTGMVSTDSITIGGLTFTAAGTLTPAQTAAAFANLTAGATQGNSVLGTYSGAVTGWTSGAVTGTATVLFTSTAAGNPADLSTVTSAFGALVPTITEVTGVAVAPATGKGGIADGVVSITDANFGTGVNTITTATVDGYATASFVASDALTTLSLANSTGMAFNVGNNTATTLGLTVNKLGVGSTLDLDAANPAGTYTHLNITTATADSILAVTGAAVTALTIAGTNAADLTSSVFTALKTVTVSGAAGVTGNFSGATTTDVNASGTSGAVTVTIDASLATYEGGTGADSVTTTGAGVAKVISLGDGNDTLTLAPGTSAVTAAVTGGGGTDTLVMVAADAALASASATFGGLVTGFDVLELTGGNGDTVKVDVLGPYHSVTTGGATGLLTMTGFASGDTLTLTSNAAGGSYVVSSPAWTTPTTDSFNVVLSSDASLTAGAVTAAKVETIHITSTDTKISSVNADTLTLTAADATAVTVAGNSALTLTMTGSTKVASIDAHTMTGGLTVTSLNVTTATTITGGFGADVLTAATGTTADHLLGGAGADTLTANAGLDVLTGGASNDLFVIATPGANVNVYSTIIDALPGDRIQLLDRGTETFNHTALTLGDTAVFQDYANLAAVGTGAVNGAISWFQFANNTYIVEDLTATASFVNGADIVVKLTGLVDLSTASLNAALGAGTPPILLVA